MKNYLEFEKEIKLLETDLDSLKSPFGSEGISEVDTQKIRKTEEEINNKLKFIYENLNSWQKTLVARHEDRPKANFYIKKIFSSFTALSGDRLFSDDQSVIAGFGLIDNKSVLVIGQEKGEDLTSRIERNFGMMRPEGYRKCIRLMQLANRFQIPVVSFIDTPGAYPGIGAEQRGQASAIASSIECGMSLNVPNISIIIGEGGSGGAIALASSNKVIMLENSIYSVISPEGCASILWRDQSKSLQAAEAMKLTAKDLLELGIIDEVIKEPLGGAHRDKENIAQDVKHSIIKNLKHYESFSREEIYNDRKDKFLKIGRDKGFTQSAKLTDSSFGHKDSFFLKMMTNFGDNKPLYYGLLAVSLTILITLFSVAQ
jgi:acetyl-CoA carboxylase carboxyl transferase subunit alpha